MEKNKDHLDSFTSLGSTLIDDPPAFNKFVCELYGHQDSLDVNRVRFEIFKSGKFSEESLPPTEDSLLLHSQRANYQAYIWRHASTALLNLPSATDHGWESTADSGLEIKWLSLPIAPDSILSFITCGCTKGCSTNRCSCKKASLKCTDLCKCKDCENIISNTSKGDEEEEEDYDLVFCGNDDGSDSDSEDDFDSGSDSDTAEDPISEWETSAFLTEDSSPSD